MNRLPRGLVCWLAVMPTLMSTLARALALATGAAAAQPASTAPSSAAAPLSAPALRAGPAPLVLQASTREPRAYGYQVGDTLQRQVLIQVPAGLVLDAASLPLAGARGQAIELRALHLQSQATYSTYRRQTPHS